MHPPRRQLRVLTLLDHAVDLGGAERFALGLAAALPRERFEPWVCATRSVTPEAAAWLAGADVPFVCLGRRRKLDVHRLAGLSRLIRARRFDVLHAHMFGSNAWGAVAGRLHHVPVVIAHEHNWSYEGRRARRVIDKEVTARLATRFVTVSESSRRQMIEVENIPADKILVLPTAYVPHRGTGPAALRSELALSDRARIVAVAAPLRPEKALEVLIEAHAIVLRSVPDAYLVIVGDGVCRDQLERRVARLGISQHVRFLGVRHDVTALLPDADVGALSSDWEGMPLFALECMANLVPFVATAVGGLPELINHDRNGLLVPPREPAALAASLIDVLDNRERASRLADAAAVTVRHLTIDAVAARFAELYDDLVALAAAAGR